MHRLTRQQRKVSDRLKSLGYSHGLESDITTRYRNYRADILLSDRVVEIDGPIHTHEWQKKYDETRDYRIKKELGLPTLRFSNEEVDRDLERVVQKIINHSYRS